jgi:CRP/FNR family transcriptional regulator, cyclic AMP receptor protein
LALSNVYERTIKVLQDMAVAEGEIKIIRNRPTQQDLANMVGASREMVNKIIQELIKGGYVTVDDKDLIINKKLPASW